MNRPAATALMLILAGAALSSLAHADETAAERGYRFLTEKKYLPIDFDQQTFDDAWRSWPEPLRSQAAAASAEERREMAFSRYGLTARPGDDRNRPLQYVVDENGAWTMNCFACHGGKVAGKSIPGLTNSLFALQTLTEETRAAKLRLGKPMSRMDLATVLVPLGTTNGTTNAVMFGVLLLNYRDADLNFRLNRRIPPMTHHDMEPPPWWHMKKKKQIYIDGFAQKGARVMMQFMLVKENGPDDFRRWESDFQDVMAYVESLEAPRYPFEIDHVLAKKGEALFKQTCAKCHGEYGGEQETYPGRIVPIDEVDTDRARLDALSPEHRRRYAATWFAHYGEHRVVEDPGGYVAPPLDGVWASAPYFHNGSVPTLWHLLHSSDRPRIWKRSENGYDRQKVGLEIETFEKLPPKLDGPQRRTYFNTERFGKSAAGHEFPEVLDETEKQAVLEYLKTL